MQKRRVLFIDSAIPDEVEMALKEGFQGVTTNPSLIAKAPKGDSSKPFIDRYLDHMKILVEICKKYPTNDGTYPSLSVEVFSLDPKEMLEQAKIIRDRLNYPELAIKIPIAYKDKNYLEVIRTLSKQGYKVNATCAFSEGQLVMAAQAGARFISLFYNRLIDYFNSLPNSDGTGMEKALSILKKARKYLDENPHLECEIIQGSIRKHYDVTDGWNNGADISTAGYKIMPGMMKHQGTDESVEGFEKDLNEWMK